MTETPEYHIRPAVVPPTLDGAETQQTTPDAVSPTGEGDERIPHGTSPSPDSWAERIARARSRRSDAKRDTTTAKEPKPAKPVPPMPRKGQIARPLTEMYGGIGLVVYGLDQPCGTAIISNAANAAESLEELARVNPAARRVIMAMLTTGAWGQVIAAHMPILAVIAVHHGSENLGNLLKPLAVALNNKDEAPPADSAGERLTTLLDDTQGEQSA